MFLRYPTQCAATSVGTGSTSFSNLGDMPNIFLIWNHEDPVSEVEINRNNFIESLQGNRKPFIDNPYIATMIWNGPAATDTWGVLSLPYTSMIDNITLYPNITKDNVWVHNNTSTNNINNIKYSISNTLGQTIQEGNLSTNIDFSNEKTGLYIVKLYSNNYFKTFKIIKK